MPCSISAQPTPDPRKTSAGINYDVTIVPSPASPRTAQQCTQSSSSPYSSVLTIDTGPITPKVKSIWRSLPCGWCRGFNPMPSARNHTALPQLRCLARDGLFESRDSIVGPIEHWINVVVVVVVFLKKKNRYLDCEKHSRRKPQVGRRLCDPRASERRCHCFYPASRYSRCSNERID